MKFQAYGFPVLMLALAVSEASHAAVTATNDSAATAVNTPVTIDVLANDISTVGQQTLFLDSEGYISGAYGTVTLNPNDNTLTYVPGEGFEGTDTFTYFAVDQEGFAYGGSAVVTVTVSAATTPPAEGSIESFVRGNSNRRTAAMLDDVCAKSTAGGGEGNGLSVELNARCGELLDAAEQNSAALNQMVADIAPEEILVMRSLMAGMIRNHTSRLYQFQDSLRPGSAGEAVTINNSGLMLNSYKGGAAGDEAPRWGVFGSVHTDQAEHDQTDFESGYEYAAYGFTAGVDYRLRPDLHVGGAMNWINYDLDYDSNGGTLDSDLYTFTGYLSWFIDQLSVDAQLGYSAGDFSTERNIKSFGTWATGDTESEQYNLSAQVDYSLAMDAFTARPFLRLDYLSTTIDGYTETGGAGLAMGIEDQDLDQVTASLGVDTTYAISFDWGVLVPGVKLAAVNDTSTDYAPVVFHLLDDASSDGVFSLRPDGEDSMYYQLDLGAVFQLKNGIATFLTVQNTFGYDDLSAYQVVGGFNIEL